MGALTSANVTVTATQMILVGLEKRVIGTIVFGDGALTYPTGGVPLPAKTTYFRLQNIHQLTFTGDGTGYVYKYDYTNHTLLMYQPALVSAGTAATHVHDMLFIGGIAATETTGIVTLTTWGKLAATNRTIAGSASATKGGIVSASPAVTLTARAAAAMSECVTTVTPASTTLYFEAWGK